MKGESMDEKKEVFLSVIPNEIKEKLDKDYVFQFKCPFCNSPFDFNFNKLGSRKFKGVCFECHHEITIENTEQYVPEIILRKYKVITTKDQDEDIFFYEPKYRIWSNKKSKAIINEIAASVLGKDLNQNIYNKILLQLKAKTYDERNFVSAMKEVEGKIYYNFRNGVVELDLNTKKAKLLKDFDATNLKFLSYFHVDFKENAKLPGRFLSLLYYMFDGDERKILDILEAIAYVFVPGYPIKKLIALYGKPNTGKTTFFTFLEELIGEENISHLTLQTIARANERMFTLTKLYGKIANIADDLPKTKIYDPGVIKMSTGGSTISAERKFGGIFDFVNEAKIFVSANELPEFSEDAGLLDRLKLIGFTKEFKGNVDRKKVVEYYMNEEEKSKLVWFIFNNILPNLLGKSKFTYNEPLEDIKIEYYKNANSSWLFWNFAVEEDSEAQVEKREFVEKYKEFCKLNNFIPVDDDYFWKTMRKVWGDRVYEGKKQIENKRIRYIYGLEIKEDLLFGKLVSVQPVQSVQPFHIFKNISKKQNIFKKVKTLTTLDSLDTSTQPSQPPQPFTNPLELHLQRINNHNQEPAYYLAKLIPNSHINKSLYKEGDGKGGKDGNGGNNGNMVTNLKITQKEESTPQPPQPTQNQQSNFLPIKLALRNLKQFDKDFETCKFVRDYLKQNFDIKIAVVDEIFKVIDKLEENGNIFKNPSTKKYEWLRFEDWGGGVDV
jgi:putative DNA primase/helicase